jgi:hypothetical protein
MTLITADVYLLAGLASFIMSPSSQRKFVWNSLQEDKQHMGESRVI